MRDNPRKILNWTVLGEAEADTLAMPTQFDRTHLGSKGAALFSQLVLRELTQLLPGIAHETRH